MQNIVTYVNTLLSYIFGSAVYIYPPGELFNYMRTTADWSDIWGFIAYLFKYPTVICSFIVWGWFFWLAFNLLLRWPFNWIRSVIRKCKI